MWSVHQAHVDRETDCRNREEKESCETIQVLGATSETNYKLVNQKVIQRKKLPNSDKVEISKMSKKVNKTTENLFQLDLRAKTIEISSFSGSFINFNLLHLAIVAKTIYCSLIFAEAVRFLRRSAEFVEFPPLFEERGEGW